MSEHRNVPPGSIKPVFYVILAILILAVLSAVKPFTTIKAGHVGVATLFGKPDQEELQQGFHLINPLKKVIEIDCREKELTLEDVGVPSQDQLTTQVDITVKWRVDKTAAAAAYEETGDAIALEQTHLVPAFRSLIREAGKGVVRAEDFYKDDIQNSMQAKILEGLQSKMPPKGILIDGVLMRQVELPRAVKDGVVEKKRQEQRAEQQKAEFERFKTEQQQKVASAEAERDAAIQEAEKRRALADAKAYEITAEAKARAEAIRIEGQAIRNSPDLIKLRAIEKWTGTVPRVSLGGGGGGNGGSGIVPFINLDELSKDE